MNNPEENEKTDVIARAAKQSVANPAELTGELKTLLEAEQRARAAAEGELAKREQSLADTVAAYKVLVVRSNPGIPVELISGDSFKVVDTSLESAKALVAKVRLSVEAEIAAGKVPAGAPARIAPDLENLSSREKIQLALARRQG